MNSIELSKVEIFLPLPGMGPTMEAYFTSPNVIRIGGSPVGRELHDAELTEEELLEIGLEAAQDKINEITRGADEDYFADSSYPFIGEMLTPEGKLMGWEFEFGVFTR